MWLLLLLWLLPLLPPLLLPPLLLPLLPPLLLLLWLFDLGGAGAPLVLLPVDAVAEVPLLPLLLFLVLVLVASPVLPATLDVAPPAAAGATAGVALCGRLAQKVHPLHLHRLQCDAFCFSEQKAVHDSTLVSPVYDELHAAPNEPIASRVAMASSRRTARMTHLSRRGRRALPGGARSGTKFCNGTPSRVRSRQQGSRQDQRCLRQQLQHSTWTYATCYMQCTARKVSGVLSSAPRALNV